MRFGSTPNPCPAARASPDSLRRMRLNTGSDIIESSVAPSGAFSLETCTLLDASNGHGTCGPYRRGDGPGGPVCRGPAHDRTAVRAVVGGRPDGAIDARGEPGQVASGAYRS